MRTTRWLTSSTPLLTHLRGLYRPWIKRLHKFSHVDRLGVRMAILPGQDGPSFALGPQQNALLFRYCAEEASATLLFLIEAVDNLRRVVGYGPLDARDEYAQRRADWQATLVETADEHPSSSRLSVPPKIPNAS